MSDADKEQIRQAIMRATKLPLGEIYPEAFIDAKRGGIVTAVIRDAKTPHMKLAYVTTAGKLITCGAAGLN